ncbi:MAG: nucleotidyl transferase AbiEii/AbiGii toxin family protein [Candidatus Marinimicrobia bacterium]|nr:nucleotidyl transferase AbiEii/AbiGii toxin family protein [Candidatus Neomarinimicrobiota bacterium]
MINKDAVTIDWIKKVSAENKQADKILVEKLIHALLLLEGLAIHEIPFVFKGGTALMLHLNSTKRLSIDIDIILPAPIGNYEFELDTIVKEQGFIRKELQYRQTKLKIDKEHYKFFYTPLHKSNKIEEYILLDILFEDIMYKKLEKIPIKSSFLPAVEIPVYVNIPSKEDMLGDKLTAFAPNTTGIPYYKNEDSMSMEIIKQLYDIGNLIDVVEDMNIIKATFSNFATSELSYRNIENKTENDVLDDIVLTSLCIVTRGADGNGDFYQLQQGIQRVANFIFSEKYHIEKAIIHASKAAYIASLIKNNKLNIEKYENPGQVKDWVISDHKISKLNKLKKSNPEAFFYWYKIFEIRTNQLMTATVNEKN